MPSPLTIAADLVRRWTWLYTCGLDADVRDARRAEIESDLWDFRDDVKTSGANEPSAAAHVLARLALGIADDLLWRREHAILMTPATLASTGVLRTPIVVRRVSGFGVSAVCHLALLTAAVWLTPKAVAFVKPRATVRQPVIVYVPPVNTLLSRPDVAGTKAPSADAVPDDLGLSLANGDTTLDLPGFTFDFGKVVRRAGSLFPFLTGDPALDRLAQSLDERRAMPMPAIAAVPGARGEGGDVRVLKLTPAEMQTLIDKSWSRRERWSAFAPIADLVERYDPGAGQLADLVKGYVEQNGLQPYVETGTRDPRLWTQLGVAADHAEFIEFISRIVASHPGTKTATELLFLLDTIVQGSYDTLAALLDVVPDQDLGWTLGANSGAYDALVAIQKYYRAQLQRRNIASRAILRLYFDEARLNILSHIVRTTPNWYRLADAQFLTGQIYWKQGKPSLAVAAWSAMQPASDDRYRVPAAQIVALVRRDDGILDVRAINQVLDNERSRWVDFSHDRLLRFGFRFNTF